MTTATDLHPNCEMESVGSGGETSTYVLTLT